MPTKKTTTKKPVAKKATTKKPVTKKVPSKKVTIKKSPTVIVKENAIKKDACSASHCKRTSLLIVILLLINTALLLIVAFKTTSHKALFSAMDDFEAMRVGGKENHQIMKEIYKLDAYKQDQKNRLQATLQALQQMNLTPTTQGTPTPVDTDTTQK